MIRTLWLIPITLVVVGAGLALRARHRRPPRMFSLEHVSGDWLAQARGRDEQEW
jgi:cytochrome c-type biogenesis protein CcmH/NrfF